jgi:aldehyde dehydrogenase
MMLFAARTASKTLGRIGVSAAKATRSPKAGVLGRRAAPSAALSTSPAWTSGFADLGLPHKYGHFIGGEFVEPTSGKYFDNVSPIDGQTVLCQAARGDASDIGAAVDAATTTFNESWSKASVSERSNILLKIADIIEENLERLARIETADNGKAVRECLAADLPLVIDHFRYFAGVIRAEEGTASELDGDTLSLCIQEPLGVVGQIIPWNFPLLMATWKLAPALAAGNCVVRCSFGDFGPSQAAARPALPASTLPALVCLCCLSRLTTAPAPTSLTPSNHPIPLRVPHRF